MGSQRSSRSRARGTLVALMAASALSCSSEPPDPGPPTPSLRPPANVIVRSLAEGEAHLTVDGDINGTFDWKLRRVSDNADFTVATWAKGSRYFDLLAMPGAIIPGPRRTSHSLWIDLSIGSPRRMFISEDGECTLDLTRADESLAGSASCSNLTSQDGTTSIDLVATFTAGPRPP